MELSRQDKINIITEHINSVQDNNLDKIYKFFINDKKDTAKVVNIDKTTDKYKIALKFINQILQNIGKTQITDMTEFKRISRDDIIKDINKKTFELMESELFKYFDKRTCGWYRRKTIKDSILPFIRGMCKELGYLLKYVSGSIQKNNYTKTHQLYSINSAKI